MNMVKSCDDTRPNLEIFIPTYNRVKYLRQCLESVLSQTHSDFRVIILDNASDEDVDEVMNDYGKSIKELAAANIFPGDMLLKNFGVTRHGRVVFYDYDEIQPLLECNFRRIPPPRDEYEEMASRPWYSVGPNDVFPEEFRLFFSGNQRARKAFDARHSDIYEASFWTGLQDRIRDGHVDDFYPYPRVMRFTREEESRA